MAEPKAQTIQQRFGFVDGDLKSPNHDVIMAWLDSSADNIYKDICGWDKEWNIRTVDRLKDSSQKLLQEQLQDKQKNLAGRNEQRAGEQPKWWTLIHRPQWPGDYYLEEIERDEKSIKNILGYSLSVPPKPDLEIIKRWEHAIAPGKYIVGFVDMLVTGTHSKLSLTHIHGDQLEGFNANDIKTFPAFDIDLFDISICFEVKTSIPSLGELIRQIRMYQEYQKSTFYVVAPDNKFTEQLCSQGIGFVKYPEGTVSKP